MPEVVEADHEYMAGPGPGWRENTKYPVKPQRKFWDVRSGQFRAGLELNQNQFFIKKLYYLFAFDKVSKISRRASTCSLFSLLISLAK